MVPCGEKQARDFATPTGPNGKLSQLQGNIKSSNLASEGGEKCLGTTNNSVFWTSAKRLVWIVWISIIISQSNIISLFRYWTARKCRQPLSNGHFNVLMFTEFSDQIKNLNEWKSRICPFKKSNIVLQYLLLTPNFSEKG